MESDLWNILIFILKCLFCIGGAVILVCIFTVIGLAIWIDICEHRKDDDG